MSARDDAALHTPFSWLMRSIRGVSHAEFVVRTMDVTSGLVTCLQILHRDELEATNGTPTLLSAPDRENLLLLMTAAAAMLSEEADRAIDRLNDAASEGDHP